MKKNLIVLAIAAMLVFATAGSAFAAGINHSGQTGLGAQGAASVVDTAVSGANIYLTWVDLADGMGDNPTEGNSVHGNYTTTTVKCVVCHAVHYAAPATELGSAFGDYTVASDGQDADTLLRMRADAACVFCHATAGMSVNGRPVYDGLGAAALVGNGLTGGDTDTGHITGANCSYCHTNVHAAGADLTVPAYWGYLLKEMPATDVQGTGDDTTNMMGAMTAIEHNATNQGFADGAALGGTLADFADTTPADAVATRGKAVGVFCAECHLGAYATGAPGAATNVYGSDTVAYSGHRLAGVSAAGTWNDDGSISSGVEQGIDVAWAPATRCQFCHDAQDTFGNTAFPHSWGGTKMWLMSAADAGDTKVSVGLPSASTFDTATGTRTQLSDGVCLKCHVASGGAEGVGITF